MPHVVPLSSRLVYVVLKMLQSRELTFFILHFWFYYHQIAMIHYLSNGNTMIYKIICMNDPHCKQSIKQFADDSSLWVVRSVSSAVCALDSRLLQTAFRRWVAHALTPPPARLHKCCRTAVRPRRQPTARPRPPTAPPAPSNTPSSPSPQVRRLVSLFISTWLIRYHSTVEAFIYHFLCFQYKRAMNWIAFVDILS
jgi:hypothetical protein